MSGVSQVFECMLYAGRRALRYMVWDLGNPQEGEKVGEVAQGFLRERKKFSMDVILTAVMRIEFSNAVCFRMKNDGL